MALEGALEQMTRAHATACAAPNETATLATIERLLGELTMLRNDVRERLMKSLSKPSATKMPILK
ncbi:MAG TPA: hypothetical protein VHB97_20950 [Polyangia bacterium]|nr:hypothetical protein [Polyangia bacterium]